MRAVLVISAFIAGSAWAAMPTDADLKTAYCIAVVKRNVIFIEASLNVDPLNTAMRSKMQRRLREKNTDLERLQSYVVPKLQALDPAPLVAAANRASADFEEIGDFSAQCAPKCQPYARSGSVDEGWSACFDRCMEASSAQKRINSCLTIDWLPF